MSTCQVTSLKLNTAKHSNLKSMYMPSLPMTKFKVSNNLSVKVYPANYPAVISGRSRIWPDSEKWLDIRREPELNSGATVVSTQTSWGTEINLYPGGQKSSL
jgi:hypothetical protein